MSKMDSMQFAINNWLEASSGKDKKEYTAQVKALHAEAEEIYGKVVLSKAGGRGQRQAVCDHVRLAPHTGDVAVLDIVPLYAGYVMP